MRLRLLVLALALGTTANAQQPPRITSPKQEFGHNFGDDYFLANYRQIEAYWHKLDRESDRMVVQSIGKTAEGREHLMAIVTSPANHRQLARYKGISERLAKARLTEAEARALAKTGKAVVWIDGGLHATEVLGAQQLGEMVYQMVSRTDDETMRILDDVIILFVHANPDGNDLVADWYMRRSDTLRRSTSGIPRLYQKYIGHDNNRDFFASTQPETENINRVLYHEWFPQILYNHHQSGPAGTIFWSPPLRDPYNYNLDPIVLLGFQALGAAMHTRLAAEGKPGATMRSGGPYDGWWNGGIRNTAAFHNTIALLTEMIGNPTPMRVPLRMERQLPGADLAYPIAPQLWRFRQSVDYSISLNRAVLDYASRNRENVLYNIYAAGARQIAMGSRDNWTPNPKRYAEFAARFNADSARDRDTTYWQQLHKPEWRDALGYVIPSNQRDFPTATKFVNALRETGIRVHQAATEPLHAQEKVYPVGSFFIGTDQAFRPHVLDMFEPQVHPDVFPIPGGPPTPPYDNAGWTLAYQMGVEFDRILEPKSVAGGLLREVTEWNLPMPPGRVSGSGPTYAFDRGVNNSFIAANRLVKQGAQVTQAGSIFSAKASSQQLAPIARELGVSFNAAGEVAGAVPVRGARVGLWDQYGGSMDAGWARWILEQFEFPFTRVFAQELDAGNLDAKYDVLVFVSGGIPDPAARADRGPPAIPDVPAEYQSHVGRVTVERTLPQIKAFIEKGGTVVAIGESAPNLAEYLGLPIENHLSENGRAFPRSMFYLPGSVVRARLDTTNRFAAGMRAQTDFFFDNSPVFRLKPGAEAAGVKRVAWFEASPLRSGWAWGERYLENGAAIVEAKVGNGTALLVGPEILQRAQPHPTFKVLFNAILESGRRAAATQP